jgi:hypothetical protein
LTTKMLASTVQFSRYGQCPSPNSPRTPKRCRSDEGRPRRGSKAQSARSLRTQQRASALTPAPPGVPYRKSGRTNWWSRSSGQLVSVPPMSTAPA